MNKKDIVSYTAKQLATMQHKSETNFEFLHNLTDAEIEAASREDQDLQETTGNWYESAIMITPKAKRQLTIRLEAEVIDWYKGQGKGYQLRMSDVLKAYMLHHKKQS